MKTKLTLALLTTGILGAHAPLAAQFNFSNPESRAQAIRQASSGFRPLHQAPPSGGDAAKRSDSANRQVAPSHRQAPAVKPRTADIARQLNGPATKAPAQSKSAPPQKTAPAPAPRYRPLPQDPRVQNPVARPNPPAKPSAPTPAGSFRPEFKSPPLKTSIPVKAAPVPKAPTTKAPAPARTGPPVKSTQPVAAKPAVPRPAVIGVGQMVTTLQGRPITGAATKPEVAERITKIAPSVMPKGYETFRMKRGRDNAEGLSLVDGGPTEGTVAYMKKGRESAEGVAASKEGRPHASGAPSYLPDTTSSRPGPSTGGHLASHAPSGGSSVGHAAYPSTPPSQIGYRVDNNSRLATDAVRFRKASTELADEASYQYLLNLAAALQSSELSGHRFVLEGHASAEGREQANLILSQRRANAIYDFLVGRGVAPDRLLALGHGTSHARFAAHEPEYLLAQDRQVMVFRLAE